VTTQAASSIGQTSAILNGTITDIGTTSPAVRGFVYGADATYGATTTDSAGPFSAGAFSTTVPDLTCSTSYHFSAYATSTNGIGYGADTTFSTGACSTGGGGGGGGGGNGPVAGSIVLPVMTARVSSSTSTGPSASTGSTAGTSPSSPQASNFEFTRGLELGSTGNDVRALQAYLNTHGYPVATTGAGSPGNETSYFGPGTQAALAEFQVANGITSDTGYLGPRTRALIARVGTGTTVAAKKPSSTTTSAQFQFTQNLAFGVVDDQVTELQQFLNAQNFTVATSGPGSPGNEVDVFGSKTKAALIAFQEAHADDILAPYGLTNGTGVFGTTTRNYINGL
jgi:peptidoglycan hydrolase-like protein with peptidoglycan-binding domain